MSDIVLETFLVVLLLVLSFYAAFLFVECCDDLNTLISSVRGAASTLITQLEVSSIFKQNLVKLALAVLPIIFSVCCSFYVAYGRTLPR